MIDWPAAIATSDDGDYRCWSEENCIARAYVLETMREEVSLDLLREVMGKVLLGEFDRDHAKYQLKRVLVEEMEEGARSMGIRDEQLISAVIFCDLELCEDEASGQLFFRNGPGSFIDLTDMEP